MKTKRSKNTKLSYQSSKRRNNYSNLFYFPFLFAPTQLHHEPPCCGSRAKAGGNCVDGSGIECEGPTNAVGVLVKETMEVDGSGISPQSLS